MEGLVQVAARVTSRGQIGLGFWPIFFSRFPVAAVAGCVQ